LVAICIFVHSGSLSRVFYHLKIAAVQSLLHSPGAAPFSLEVLRSLSVITVRVLLGRITHLVYTSVHRPSVRPSVRLSQRGSNSKTITRRKAKINVVFPQGKSNRCANSRF